MFAQTIVSIQNLNYFFGEDELRKQILFDINLEIKAKEFVILTGPSGSGKSTLLSLIGCLRSVQEGSITILEQELNGATKEKLVQMRRNFGYVTQSSSLLDFLTVEQNIQMSLELHSNFSPKEARSKIEAILESIGLREKINAYPSNLSGGQKQRVAIASALVSCPSLVLADEPTAALDRTSGRNVVALMQRLAKEQNSAVLMVTHDNRILDLADRIINVEDGKLGLALHQELSLALPGFNESALMQTVNQPTVLTYQSEEVIVQQGDPANKFYILLEGEVNIMQESADQPPRLINHLKRGDYFGEVGLLQGGKRTATVRVVKDSEVKVMVIEEEMFQNFLSSSDLTNSDVVRRVHQRLFSSYLSKALPNIETYQIRAIASQAKVIRYGANSTIVQQGTLADKFYLILAGTAEVLVSDGNNSTSYQIKTGDYFGNTQLIDGEEYPFTVRVGAKADADLMVLDRETFCSVIGVIAK